MYNKYTFIVSKPSIFGGVGSGHYGHAGRTGEVGGSSLGGGGLPRFHKTASPLFINRLNNSIPEEYKGFVSEYSPEEYRRTRTKLFLSPTKKSGFGLSPDGNIVSVFSEKGSGEGRKAMVNAIKNGGNKLDAFDGFLPTYYKRFGFKEVGRAKFDRKLAPANWDYKEFDEPDVVFMERIKK